jgi:hypothetical protein
MIFIQKKQGTRDSAPFGLCSCRVPLRNPGGRIVACSLPWAEFCGIFCSDRFALLPGGFLVCADIGRRECRERADGRCSSGPQHEAHLQGG